MKETHFSFRNGLFVPGQSPPEHPITENHELSGPVLTERERGIFDRLGVDPPSTFTRFLNNTTGTIMRQELGTWKPDPQTDKARRYFGRLMVEIDDVYDNNRIDFPREDRNKFFSAVQGIEIVTMGEPHFRAGEGFTIHDKLIADSSLYSPQARGLLKTDSDVAFRHGWQELIIDPSKESAEDVQRAVETSNGLFLMMLFDLTNANLAEQPGFYNARDRFIASLMGYQYRDNFRDVGEDIDNNCANVLVGYARKLGEYDALAEGIQDLQSPRVNLLLPQGEHAAFDRYFAGLERLAPQSYSVVADRQQELLDIAALPDLSARVAVPRMAN